MLPAIKKIGSHRHSMFEESSPYFESTHSNTRK